MYVPGLTVTVGSVSMLTWVSGLAATAAQDTDATKPKHTAKQAESKARRRAVSEAGAALARLLTILASAAGSNTGSASGGAREESPSAVFAARKNATANVYSLLLPLPIVALLTW